MRFLLPLLIVALPLGAQPRKPAAAPDTAAQRLLAAERSVDPKYAPDRHEGDGPFPRLVIRGATLIDGTGGPPRGPVDIVVENNRIIDVVNVGVPYVAI